MIFFSYTILMLMPYQVTLVPNYLVTKWLGILDTRWAIILTGIFSPMAVFILTKYMRRIPVSYVEAAKLDGAGEWQIFSKVFMPLSGGVIYSVAILVFIDNWNMVEQPLILLENEWLYPLALKLHELPESQYAVRFAGSVLYMLPSILLFFLFENELVDGAKHMKL